MSCHERLSPGRRHGEAAAGRVTTMPRAAGGDADSMLGRRLGGLFQLRTRGAREARAIAQASAFKPASFIL